MGNETGPDDTLSPSESLDSDEVRNADGDEVVDAPTQWSAAMTHDDSESLDAKLDQEVPDVGE